MKGLEQIEQLRLIRKMHKVSQQDIADIVGVSRSYFSQMENGKYNPSVDVLAKWCNALGCRLSITITDI